jgi:hypothetical protein
VPAAYYAQLDHIFYSFFSNSRFFQIEHIESNMQLA